VEGVEVGRALNSRYSD